MQYKGWFRRGAMALAMMVAAGGLLGNAQPAAAQGQSYLKVGVLTCAVSPGVGVIVGSSKTMSCTFVPEARGPEHYSGRITRVGLDVGVTGATVIVWAVLSKVHGFPAGALAGTYVGGSAEATVGVGLGANVLLGGSSRSFALQPVSVQGQVGLDFAVGIAKVTLNAH